MNDTTMTLPKITINKQLFLIESKELTYVEDYNHKLLVTVYPGERYILTARMINLLLFKISWWNKKRKQ